MSQVMSSFAAKPHTFKSVLDSTDIKSFIDIELNSRKQTSIDQNTPTGLPNTAVALGTKVKIGATVVTISTTGAACQNYGMLISELNADLGSNGTATLLTTEKRIRISATASGATPIAMVEVGTLVAGLTGTVADPMISNYMPAITGGGAVYRVSNLASVTNPVECASITEVVVNSTGKQYNSYVKTYSDTLGILSIQSDGTNFFVAGDTIVASVHVH